MVSSGATDDRPDSPLEFRILGPLEVLRDGREVPVGGARQQMLLAALLVHANQVVSSDRLIDELWGEQPPETAVTALHGLVSQIRKALEPDRAAGAPGAVLVTRPPGYALLIAPEALDATRFERLLLEGREALEAGDAGRAAEKLRAGLGLWRGQALAGVDDTPSAHAEAHRLDELRLEALEDRIGADLALGRDAVLVPELEVLVECEPLRERPRGQLMLALYRAGRQAEALELYKETRRTFVERLGIEPTPRLRELEQAILAQDPELEAGLPRIRPPAVLRRPHRRALAGIALLGIAVLAGTAGALLARGDGAAVVAPPGSVAVVDAKTARIVDTVEVGSGPSSITVGHDSLWVANAESDTVSRIDPESREVVATIGVPSPVDLGVGPDAIWVASGIDGTVSRIDPESNDVVATIDVRGADPFVPQTAQAIAAGPTGAWAAVSGRELARIDAADNRVTRLVAVGDDQLAAALGHGALWVITVTEKLLRIEPTTGALTSTLSVGSPGASAHDVVIADDGVLVLVGDDVWVVDPVTVRLTRTLSVGSFVAGVADQPGPGLWAVTSAFTSKSVLTRLDPDSADTAPVRMQFDSQATAVAVAAGAVWVTIGELEG